MSSSASADASEPGSLKTFSKKSPWANYPWAQKNLDLISDQGFEGLKLLAGIIYYDDSRLLCSGFHIQS